MNQYCCRLVLILLICTPGIPVYCTGQPVLPAATTYFNRVYAAEEQIINGRYDTACKLYHSLIHTYQARTHPADLFNAFAANLICRNHNEAVRVLQLLRQKNISIRRLLANPALDSLLRLNTALVEHAAVQQLISNDVPQPVYQSLLDSIFERDQAIRRKKDAYTLLLNEMQQVDTSNAAILYAIIQKHGIPGDDELLYGGRKRAMTKTQLIILHQNRWHSKDFTDLLIAAVNQLQLRPSVAAFLIDNYRQSNNYHSAALTRIATIDTCLMPTGWLVRERTAAELAQLDNTRMQLALEPYAQFVAKAIYSLNDSVFIWQNSFAKTTLNMSSCEQAKAIAGSAFYKPIVQ